MKKKIVSFILLACCVWGQAILSSNDTAKDELFLYYQKHQSFLNNQLWQAWVDFEKGDKQQALHDAQIYIDGLDNNDIDLLTIEFKNCTVVPDEMSRADFLCLLYQSAFIAEIAKFTNGAEFRRRLRDLVAKYSGLYARLRAAFDFYHEFLSYYFSNFAGLESPIVLEDVIFDETTHAKALVQFQRLYKGEPQDQRIEKLKDISNRHLRLFDAKSVDAAYKSLKFFLESQLWSSWSALYDDKLTSDEKEEKRLFATQFFEGDHQFIFTVANFYAAVSQHTYLFDKEKFINEVKNETFFAVILGMQKANKLKELLFKTADYKKPDDIKGKFEFPKKFCKNDKCRSTYLTEMIDSLKLMRQQNELSGLQAFLHLSEEELTQIKQAFETALTTEKDVFFLPYKHKNLEFSLYAWFLLANRIAHINSNDLHEAYDELLRYFSRRDKLIAFLTYNDETNIFDIAIVMEDERKSLRKDIFSAHITLSKKHFNEVYYRFNGNKPDIDAELIDELKNQVQEEYHALPPVSDSRRIPKSATQAEKKREEQLKKQAKQAKIMAQKEAYWERKKAPKIPEAKPQPVNTSKPPKKNQQKKKQGSNGKKQLKKAQKSKPSKTNAPLEVAPTIELACSTSELPEYGEHLEEAHIPDGNARIIESLYGVVLRPEQIASIKAIEHKRVELDTHYHSLEAKFEEIRTQHQQMTDILIKKNISVHDALQLRVSLVARMGYEQRTTMAHPQEDLCSKNCRMAKQMMNLKLAMSISDEAIAQKIREAQEAFRLLEHQLEQEASEVEMRSNNAQFYIEQLSQSLMKLKQIDV